MRERKYILGKRNIHLELLDWLMGCERVPTAKTHGFINDVLDAWRRRAHADDRRRVDAARIINDRSSKDD